MSELHPTNLQPTDLQCGLLIIGAGPGGYVAAIRAGQLGIDTVLVDPQRPGGTSLNEGCVPSKALIYAGIQTHRVRSYTKGSPLGLTVDGFSLDLHATIAWKDGLVDRLSKGVTGLLQNAGVRLLAGSAQLLDGKSAVVTRTDGSQVRVQAGDLVIATGSEPVTLPDLPFGGPVIGTREALSLNELPDRMVIIGAGATGMELASAFAKLGSQVTVVEMQDRILPKLDPEISRVIARRSELLGIRLLTGTRPLGLTSEGAVQVAVGERHDHLEADRVVICAGRVPRTKGFALEGLSLTMDDDAIRIDEYCRTSMRGVYAVGDVTGAPMLAHRAMGQGQVVAERVAGQASRWEPHGLPRVLFTDPECVVAGLEPEEARAAGHEVVVGRFPLRGNARALMQEDTGGFVRVVARASDHLVLGVQAVGTNVSELAAACSLAVENGLRLEDLHDTIQAHPTQGEALTEAGWLAHGPAVHI